MNANCQCHSADENGNCIDCGEFIFFSLWSDDDYEEYLI
jgi:hypothetical protein